MTAPELKPCPFCGAVDPEWLASHVVCDCGATGPRQDVDREYQADAMRALTDWNRRADLAAVQPAQVRVKPLVWRDDGTNGHETDHAFGFYEVYPSPEGDMLSRDGVDSGVFPTLEAAKAAAQTDYEARILAALEPQPDPRDEVIKGLVEAATGAAEAIDMAYGSDDDESPHRHSAKLRAALAAAKAVQK